MELGYTRPGGRERSADVTERVKGDGVLVAITAVWGITFLVTQDALAHVDPATLLAGRYLVGALGISAFAGRRLLERRSWGPAAVLGSLLFLGTYLQTWGLEYTTPSRSAFVTGLSVVLVPVLAIGLLRRRPPLLTVGGVGLAFGGLWLLTDFSLEAPSGAALGDVLTLGCAVLYAGYILLLERYARIADARALVALQLWVCFLGSAAATLLGPTRFDVTGEVVVIVVFLGLVASGLLILLQTWAQARTSAVHAALIFALEPVFTSIYSIALGRERLGPGELWGGALILVGIVAAELGPAIGGSTGSASPGNPERPDGQPVLRSP